MDYDSPPPGTEGFSSVVSVGDDGIRIGQTAFCSQDSQARMTWFPVPTGRIPVVQHPYQQRPGMLDSFTGCYTSPPKPDEVRVQTAASPRGCLADIRNGADYIKR
jgi:hypothetical protein